MLFPEKNGRYRDNVVEFLFEGYQTYYKTQNVVLFLEKTEEKEEDFLFESGLGNRRDQRLCLVGAQFAGVRRKKVYETAEIRAADRAKELKKSV